MELDRTSYTKQTVQPKQQTITSILDRLEDEKACEEKLNLYCYKGLSQENISQLKTLNYDFYQGKVRDCALRNDFFYMIHTDRLSAFDCPVALVPFKGALLSAINSFWLKKASSDFPIANFSYPETRVIKMKKLNVFPIEVIVRGYLAGSMLRSYEKGQRKFCHHVLPDNLKPWQSLENPIITPTSKAEVGEHDENMTPDEILESKICTISQWESISKLALELFNFGSALYKDLGWILVDTKYEFGYDEKGEVYLIDELHTPDSSRLWVKDSYEDCLVKKRSPVMLDKEIIRNYLLNQGFKGDGPVPHIPISELIGLSRVYLEVAEKLHGGALTFDSMKDQNQCIFSLLRSA